MAYLGNTVTTQGFIPAIDYFNGDGTTTAFTLSRPVASVAQVQVVVNNVPQLPGTAFTVSANTITFTGAPSSGTSNIYVYYTSPITQVIAPSQGTVGTSAFASSTGSGAVVLATNPTIASPVITGSTPQITVYSSGSGTYTTPTNCRYLWVRCVGGGGGGGGGNSGTVATSGGSTTFGTSLLTANGGSGSAYTTNGDGGTASGGDVNAIGGTGCAGAFAVSGTNSGAGGAGGNSFFGGAGKATYGAGNAGNIGGGGAGGGCTAIGSYGAFGGGAGAYTEKLINSPSATYSYAVGSGGSGASAGASAYAGGAGGSGIIIVTAFF